jgi:peptidyl-prolyl cis-trans isomerase C
MDSGSAQQQRRSEIAVTDIRSGVSVRALTLIVVSALSPFMLTGCDTASGHKSQSPTVVRVNGSDITMDQIDYALAHVPGANNVAPRHPRDIAEQYVDQQLLLQKALEKELHRDAQVAQALEQMRRQVLAQAYLNRVVDAAPAPSAKEIADYYRFHPELFAQRKQYVIQQLTVDKSVPMADLERKVHSGVDIKEVASWLREKDALRSSATQILPAEKITLTLLPQLNRMAPGDRLVWEEPAQRLVIALVSAEPRPLSEQDATAAIQRYLWAERREALRMQEIQRLRMQAKIEWVDELSTPTAFDEPASDRRVSVLVGQSN